MNWKNFRDNTGWIITVISALIGVGYYGYSKYLAPRESPVVAFNEETWRKIGDLFSKNDRDQSEPAKNDTAAKDATRESISPNVDQEKPTAIRSSVRTDVKSGYQPPKNLSIKVVSATGITDMSSATFTIQGDFGDANRIRFWMTPTRIGRSGMSSGEINCSGQDVYYPKKGPTLIEGKDFKEFKIDNGKVEFSMKFSCNPAWPFLDNSYIKAANFSIAFKAMYDDDTFSWYEDTVSDSIHIYGRDAPPY